MIAVADHISLRFAQSPHPKLVLQERGDRWRAARQCFSWQYRWQNTVFFVFFFFFNFKMMHACLQSLSTLAYATRNRLVQNSSSKHVVTEEAPAGPLDDDFVDPSGHDRRTCWVDTSAG